MLAKLASERASGGSSMVSVFELGDLDVDVLFVAVTLEAVLAVPLNVFEAAAVVFFAAVLLHPVISDNVRSERNIIGRLVRLIFFTSIFDNICLQILDSIYNLEKHSVLCMRKVLHNNLSARNVPLQIHFPSHSCSNRSPFFFR